MKLKFLFLSIVAVFFFINVSAKVVLPKILCSNMVLQRNSEVKLWGTAEPDSKVKISVSWSKDKVQTNSGGDGRWEVKVQTPDATFEPQTIVISDGEKLTLENILIGDVWICSGQSNMEMPMKGYNSQTIERNMDYILNNKANKSMRMFKVGWARSYDKELDDCISGEWETASTESVANLSAVAYFFAHHLTQALDIPIGVVTPYWGGTRIESWMPLNALKECVGNELCERKHKASSIKPSELYCAMIAPIRNFAAKGFIWYQGCSNLGDIDHYDKMQARMVRQWRSDWGDNENRMPFYYVQIAPYIYGGSREIAYPLFVEAQTRALSLIPNSGMATTTDLGEEYSIHPAKKFEIGLRLASLALAQTYGMKGFEPKAPTLKSFEIKDGKVLLTFNNAERGLNPWTLVPITGFEIAGADRVFHPAKAWTCDKPKEVVSVWSDDVKEPVAVRYSFRNFMPGNLCNTFGVPVAPFRTDNWNDVK